MKLFIHTIRLLVCALLALAAAAQAGPAFAGDSAPQKWTTGQIERSYRHRMQDVQATTAWLNDADGYATTIDGLITDLKAKGKDTRPLEEAVATFRSRIAALRVDNAAVLTRLTVNTGFDASGKVVDKAVAERTVREAKNMLDRISEYGDGAYEGLHEAITSYQDTYAKYEFVEPKRP